MQEHTVLDLTPLGIDRQAFRHGIKGVGLCTLIVHVPPLEYKARVLGRLVVIGSALVIGAEISAIGLVLHLFQFSGAPRPFDRIAVTIYKHTVIVENAVKITVKAYVKIGVVAHLGIDSISTLIT